MAPTRLDLRAAAKLFFRHRSPQVLALSIAVVVSARTWLGEFAVWDVVLAAGIVAFQPLREWLLHVFLLHWKPRRILGVLVDPHAAVKHRAHHADPHALELIFIPRPALIEGAVIELALWLAALPTLPLVVTAMLTTTCIGLFYEWIHFLTHVPYRPRGAWYRARWRHHRLHHFKNEQFWYGVSMHAADRLLKTAPDPSRVPTSPTARALHGLDSTA